ncbi:hypothetical protein RXY88_001702 [Salmonella enterica]|nr:hypothetical protein [Salmonella enterica]
MKEYAFYSAMEQSPRKFKQAAHSLAFLCRFTPVSHTKMKNWSLRQCVKQAKKYGWDESKNWRDQLTFKGDEYEY